ncbi:hypothetical protein D9613_012505 [Agrocybe pediades]|uniref:Uncharacterized protein n=1 Tax=Agrocybe pediades TaxID=84607 RepID=A0A8H4QRT4_9AGAR|nr:hypothetical protein D9613_012505 [Agrocybe pediades]
MTSNTREHPLALELQNLRASVLRFQDEAHQTSVKLQRHSLDSTRAHERAVYHERENDVVKAEVAILRANPLSSSAGNPNAESQIQELTLSLRRLSQKLTLTEESLLSTQTQLAAAQAEAKAAKENANNAYELGARVRGREEEGLARERSLESRVRKLEEDLGMSDGVVKEYAALVRTMQARSNSSVQELSAGPQIDKVHLEQSLQTRKNELERIIAEFQTESQSTNHRLDTLTHELDVVKSQLVAEQKTASSLTVELAKSRTEVEKMKLEDATAAKMVARYMQFSQTSTNKLLDNLSNLQVRHAGTLHTLSSQNHALSTRVRSLEAQNASALRALDELGGELMKESYGRRREVMLRIRMNGREERVVEGLRRWVRRGDELLGRLSHTSSEEETQASFLLDMAQHARILLEGLEDGVLDEQTALSISGSKARQILVSDGLERLLDELRDEKERRIGLEKEFVSQAGWMGGQAAEDVVAHSKHPDHLAIANEKGSLPPTPVEDELSPAPPVDALVVSSKEVETPVPEPNDANLSPDIKVNGLATTIEDKTQPANVAAIVGSSHPIISPTVSESLEEPEGSRSFTPSPVPEPVIDLAVTIDASAEALLPISPSLATKVEGSGELLTTTALSSSFVAPGREETLVFQELSNAKAANDGEIVATTTSSPPVASHELAETSTSGAPTNIALESGPPPASDTHTGLGPAAAPSLPTEKSTTDTPPLDTPNLPPAHDIPNDTLPVPESHAEVADDASPPPMHDSTVTASMNTANTPVLTINDDASDFATPAGVSVLSALPIPLPTHQSPSTTSPEPPKAAAVDMPIRPSETDLLLTSQPLSIPMPSPEPPKVAPHPLLADLARVSKRYDQLQKSFRDCHLALEDLKSELGSGAISTHGSTNHPYSSTMGLNTYLGGIGKGYPSSFPSSSASSLQFPSSSVSASGSSQNDVSGGLPVEILRAALARLDDYTEDARVELEIRVGDEEMAVKGWEALLSVPGALASGGSVLANDDEEPLVPFQSEVEEQIKAFVSGDDPATRKAREGFERKLEDVLHDIAVLKRVVHDPASFEPPVEANGTSAAASSSSLNLYSSANGDSSSSSASLATTSASTSPSSGWTSWIRSPSRSASPAPTPTFGSIMTSPRSPLRHSSSNASLNSTSASQELIHPPPRSRKGSFFGFALPLPGSGPTEHDRTHMDPLSHLGLRVPMPSFSSITAGGGSVGVSASGYGLTSPSSLSPSPLSSGLGSARMRTVSSTMYMLGLGQGVKSPGIGGGIGNGVGMGMARSVSAGPVATHGSFKSSVHGSLTMSRQVSEPVKSVRAVQEIMDEEEEEESDEEDEDTDVE